MIDPLDDYAESFISKKINKLFSIGAIRNFFVAFLATYLIINAEINISLTDAKFQISPTQEFLITVGMLSTPIIAFSIIILLENKQKEKDRERRVANARAWTNFVKNIQPEISDPEVKARISLTIISEVNSNDMRDTMVKYGTDIKNAVEEIETLKEEFSDLRKLAQEARRRKKV